MKIEQKAWGTVERIAEGTGFYVDLLYINRGGISSKHYHEYKSNKFQLINGKVSIKQFNNDLLIKQSTILSCSLNFITIDAGIMHQFEALEDSIVIEIYKAIDMPIDIVRHL